MADTPSTKSTSTTADSTTTTKQATTVEKVAAPVLTPETTDTAPAADTTASEPAPQETAAPAVAETPAPAPAPAPAAAPAPAPAVAPAPVAAPAVQYGVLGTSLLQQLDAYVEAMNPRRPLATSEGLKQQVTLYRVITNIINRVEDENFTAVFTALLQKFELHKNGALHEEYIFRFAEQIQLNENDRKAFHRLLNLIKVMAPVKSRDVAIKQVDFTASLNFGLTEPGRQRVLAYFKK